MYDRTRMLRCRRCRRPVEEVESTTEKAIPRPYPADLRKRVLAACARQNDTRAEIARRFAVSQSTIYGWLQQACGEGRRVGAATDQAARMKRRIRGRISLRQARPWKVPKWPTFRCR